MTQDFIKKMAEDLKRLCDVIEKYGLVDYQYGVAEERIIDGTLSPSVGFDLKLIQAYSYLKMPQPPGVSPRGWSRR